MPPVILFLKGAAMPSRQDATILLVEDDPGHARLIEENLRRAHIGNEILVLTDGKKASDYLFSEGSFVGCTRPASLLILLDLSLPIIDGYEILTRIKSDSGTRRIPVVILASPDNEHDVERCYELGCNAFISKPLDHSAFSETIQKLGGFLSMLTSPPL